MEIKLNEKEVADQILNAVSTSLVAKLIRETVLKANANQQDIDRALSYAANEVAKEVFLDYLRNNEQFKIEVRKAVEKKLNDELIAKLINTLTSKIY